MSFQNAFFRGMPRRKEALDEARASGRLFDAARLPMSLASDPSLTDTFVGKLEAARELGREQRTTDDEYALWLAENAIRLSEQVAESGVSDGGAWLRQQYIIETGKQP